MISVMDQADRFGFFLSFLFAIENTSAAPAR
jgi:hypothetical protein